MSENVDSDNIENEEIVKQDLEKKDSACGNFLKVIIIFGLVSGLVIMLLYLDWIKELLDLFISWVSKHPY